MFSESFGCFDPRRILAFPSLYRFFQDATGANELRRRFIQEFVTIGAGTRILEIGCGVGSNLEYMPDGVGYVGFDISERYIMQAKERYGAKGSFFVSSVDGVDAIKKLGSFDFVLAVGVLHHLRDDLVIAVGRQARAAMRQGGCFVAFDPCWTEKQPWLEKIMSYLDRGRYVRTKEQYIKLLESSFSSCESIMMDTRRLLFASSICVIKAHL